MSIRSLKYNQFLNHLEIYYASNTHAQVYENIYASILRIYLLCVLYETFEILLAL